MFKADFNESIDEAVQQFYERHSARKVALAAFLIGLGSIGLSYLVYAIIGSALFSILAFAFAGFLLTNLTMIFIVPPAEEIAKSKDMILSAIKDPSRIKVSENNTVTLLDESGKAFDLKGPDLKVWKTHIVPCLVHSQAGAHASRRPQPRRSNHDSEKNELEKRRRELLEIEKRVDEERKKLDAEREDIERRKAELRDLEKSLKQKSAQRDSG